MRKELGPDRIREAKERLLAVGEDVRWRLQEKPRYSPTRTGEDLVVWWNAVEHEAPALFDMTRRELAEAMLEGISLPKTLQELAEQIGQMWWSDEEKDGAWEEELQRVAEEIREFYLAE